MDTHCLWLVPARLNSKYVARVACTSFDAAQHQGIANTMVQLDSPQRLGCNHFIATDSVGKSANHTTQQHVRAYQ